MLERLKLVAIRDRLDGLLDEAARGDPADGHAGLTQARGFLITRLPAVQRGLASPLACCRCRHGGGGDRLSWL
jgi:hypothetical protein